MPGEKSLWTEPRLSSITQSSWHAHLHADLWEELYGVRICGCKLANRWSIYLITLSALLLRPVANYEVTEVRASVNCSCSKIRAATTNLLNRLLSIMKIIGNDSHYRLVGSAHSAHLLLKLQIALRAQCRCIRWRHIRLKLARESKTMTEAEDKISSRILSAPSR